MPYSRTQARKDAFERIAALKAAYTYVKVRPLKVPAIIRNSVLQNTVFQLSAALEDYILQLTSRWFLNLRNGAALSDAVPEITRAVIIARSLEEEFRRYQSYGDEFRLSRFISEQSSIIGLAFSGRNLPNIDYENVLIKDKKFPSVRNIGNLFKRLGISSISQDVSRRTAANFELRLQSFMDVRNSLAHESPPVITAQDVERYFSQVRSWIDAIDREFYSHVVTCSGATHWP